WAEWHWEIHPPLRPSAPSAKLLQRREPGQSEGQAAAGRLHPHKISGSGECLPDAPSERYAAVPPPVGPFGTAPTGAAIRGAIPGPQISAGSSQMPLEKLEHFGGLVVGE